MVADNPNIPPPPEGDELTTGTVRYVWEVIRLIPSPQDESKQIRCSMLLAAESIEQVWEYLAADRADSATEIESITRLAPLIATLSKL